MFTIHEAGNIECKCGNDELVFVRCLKPYESSFSILCRKCKTNGFLITNGFKLRNSTKEV